MPFDFETAASIVSPEMIPFVEMEVRQERARIAADRAEIPSGVRWSGMDREAFKPRTVGQILTDAQVAKARSDAFQASPRGRFIAALRGISEVGYGREAEKARSAMNRGFAFPDRKASVGEMANALIALNDVPGNEAREARQVLAELMLAEHKRAA